MSNLTKRVLTSAAIVAVIGAAALFDLIRPLAVLIAVGMCAEVVICKIKTKTKFGPVLSSFFILHSSLLITSAYAVGEKPWILLLMAMIIMSADTGAWFFGRRFGGDLMWRELSPGKTWTGQIAGILCGTMASVMYGLLGADTFLPSLMWIGMGVALLSQYGDLTASAIKRKLNVKDFGNCLPGHGGLMDRFDGWIFALPVVWLAIMG
ncbi:MAG: phosphatidate cytidylyltransferase [Rickettsiales bacterium]|jgi:phosphatidate cytidylyltransferase|nr:phosphatidate cytidylyltransferase [Rickettsiales bacterium]